MHFKILKQQIRCLDIDTLRTELWQLIYPDNSFVLRQNITIYNDTLSKLIQYFSKIPKDNTQPQIDDQINSLQQRIQCIICNDKDRNTLLLPYKHYIACRECILRCQNACPVCRTTIKQTISVLC